MSQGPALACALGIACLALPAQALDLRQAWDLLQYQGPIYRSAANEKAAAAENRALGRAGLLPQVGLSASGSRIDGSQRQPDVFGRSRDNNLDYTARSASLQLRQPLFNGQKLAGYRQGGYQADAGAAVFDAKTQDAAVQLAGRYFDVLLAHQTIELAATKLRAFEEQVASTRRRLELGDGTVTDVDEAVARRDLASAELLEARDNLQVTRRRLQEFLGEAPEHIATLQERFATPPLQPAELADWIARAGSDNPAVRARRLGVAVAEQEVAKARAGHWPTLDLVLGYTAADSDSLSTVDQRNRYGSIGLEMNMPLFSGGYTSARVRQTSASRAQAEDDLSVAREAIVSDTTREFQSVQSGEARIRALETAVRSGEKSLDSVRKGFLAGTSTNVDILDAEELVYSARRDLFEAKLRYLLSRLRLAALAGALGVDDIDQANAYLGPRLAF